MKIISSKIYIYTCILCFSILGTEMFLDSISLHAKEAPELKLKMLRPDPQGFTYSYDQDGILYTVSCQGRSGEEVGSMLIWRPNNGGKLVDIVSLSSLDEVLRSQVSHLGNNPDQKKVLQIIGPALGEYARLQTWGFILNPWECDSYIAQMKPYVSEAIYESMKKHLAYPTDDCAGDTWMVSLIVRKIDGAIELDRFYGSFYPFAISKRETEVIARVGLIPKFDFVPPSREGSLEGVQDEPTSQKHEEDQRRTLSH